MVRRTASKFGRQTYQNRPKNTPLSRKFTVEDVTDFELDSNFDSEVESEDLCKMGHLHNMAGMSPVFNFYSMHVVLQ